MLVALDFESEAIEPRPKYPPEPVGLAVLPDGLPGFYLAWGHPIENGSSKLEARVLLQELFDNESNEFIFHNAPFDCSIIEERMSLAVPWERVHDTMLLAFLANPFGELSLKPLAEQLLGEPPTEQDAVRDWLIKHGVCRSTDKGWGAYIARAPGDLVGTYAIGDVKRTLALFKYLYIEGKPLGYHKDFNLEVDTSSIGHNKW